MYIYPDNLKSKATLWLWELRDVVVIGLGAVVAIIAFSQTGITIPLVAVAVYAFLSIRHDDTSIRDYIVFAARFLFLKPQFYQWKQH